jgi:hypothetical protein
MCYEGLPFMSQKLPPKLQQVVDRFVDDLLAAVREIAFEELVAAAHAPPPPAAKARAGARVVAGARARAKGEKRERRGTRTTRARTPALEQAPHEPSWTSTSTAADITDPHALLSLALDRVAAAVEAAPVAAVTPIAAASPKAQASAPPRLRGNERLARAGSSGVVIRRVR